ncbi:hypothetical protein ElyMa_001534100 [Elysia marginata]|uniref:Tudor domain-containing protein n=1 Tax=Elysia marginata TaxID=1093978 RepID=A0AAV4JD66_9GAST|nr:hypothetical protein ElyMa_001534100 [Elysia marginata]
MRFVCFSSGQLMRRCCPRLKCDGAQAVLKKLVQKAKILQETSVVNQRTSFNAWAEDSPQFLLSSFEPPLLPQQVNVSDQDALKHSLQTFSAIFSSEETRTFTIASCAVMKAANSESLISEHDKDDRTTEPWQGQFNFQAGNSWVAVYYDEQFYVGQVLNNISADSAEIKFLEQTKADEEYFR